MPLLDFVAAYPVAVYTLSVLSSSTSAQEKTLKIQKLNFVESLAAPDSHRPIDSNTNCWAPIVFRAVSVAEPFDVQFLSLWLCQGI